MRSALLLAMMVLGLASCGPVEATAVINDATVALAGAKAADGERYAPYEYTSAELYLEKAQEERGHADYQTAIEYARKAREMARQAQSSSQKSLREGAADASHADGAPPEASEAPETPKVEEITPQS